MKPWPDPIPLLHRHLHLRRCRLPPPPLVLALTLIFQYLSYFVLTKMVSMNCYYSMTWVQHLVLARALDLALLIHEEDGNVILPINNEAPGGRPGGTSRPLPDLHRHTHLHTKNKQIDKQTH